MREIPLGCVHAMGEIKDIFKMCDSPARCRRLGRSVFSGPRL